MELSITAYLLVLRPDGSMEDCIGLEIARRRHLIGETEEGARARGAVWVPASEVPDPVGRALRGKGHRCPSCGGWTPCDREI